MFPKRGPLFSEIRNTWSDLGTMSVLVLTEVEFCDILKVRKILPAYAIKIFCGTFYFSYMKMERIFILQNNKVCLLISFLVVLKKTGCLISGGEVVV